MSTERTNSRLDTPVEKRIIQDGKVGSAAGWTVRAGAASFMSTLAASKTADDLIVPLVGLKAGDVIVGYHLVGQVESGGNTATVDCALYESLPAAAASTHTILAGTSMTQLSVATDTKMSVANTKKTIESFSHKTVLEDAAYFARILGTTAASTDVEFLGLVLYVKPAR